MDPGTRAARSQLAQAGILAAAEALATRHGLDDALVALKAARTGPHARDPLLADLFQSEAVRVFLEGLNAAEVKAHLVASKAAKDAEKAASVKASDAGKRVDAPAPAPKGKG